MLQSSPTIHQMRRDFSASSVNDAIGSALSDIKDSSDLTYTKIGLKLGKSADAATQYCHGDAGMSAATLVQATVTFGPSLANAAFALAGYRLETLGAGKVDALPLSALLHRLMGALQDGNVSAAELADMRSLVDNAQAVLDALRARYAAGVR